MTRDDIIAEAREWLGTPWKHQASLKGIGADCIGLIVGVARALGSTEAERFLASPQYRNYGRAPQPAMLLSAADEFLDRIDIGAAGLGDILLMRFNGDPQHFAFVSRVNPVYILHAYAPARKVTENVLDAPSAARVYRAFRLRDLED